MLLAQDGEVLPIFIFDKKILNTLEKNDKRVYFIYQSVLKLKENLQKMGLDLAIFYSIPIEVFTKLKAKVLMKFTLALIIMLMPSKEMKKSVKLSLYIYSMIVIFLIKMRFLKSDGTPYLVFTPYYHAGQKLYTKFHALSYTNGIHTPR